MNSTIGDRLKEVRKGLNMKNQSQLAEKLGITQTTLSKYEKGTSDIPDDVKLKIGGFGINLHWLLTGMGAMFLPQNDTLQAQDGIASREGITNISGTVGIVKNLGEIQNFTVTPPVPSTEEHEQEEQMAGLSLYEIPLLTREQVLRFDPSKEIPDPKAHSGDYPDYTLVHVPLRFREYGTDLRAMVVFNSLMSPLLNPGEVAIFQATGWNGNGVYVYRLKSDLYISHVRFTVEAGYVLTKEFKPAEAISCDTETFEPIGRIRAVVRDVG
jgi:transcriptional regulator with XRE-family HTH domain